MMRDVDCFFVHSAIEIVRFYVHRKHYFISQVSIQESLVFMEIFGSADLIVQLMDM
jgi:hypothetical protein